MAKPKFKINLFDAFFIVFLLLVGLTFVLSWNNEPYLGEKEIIVDVLIDDPAVVSSISSQLSQNKVVYIDSHRYCGRQVKSEIFVEHLAVGNDVTYALISIKGLGSITKDRSSFLGHRIYANQEVQLRGNYSANGRITDFYYEDD